MKEMTSKAMVLALTTVAAMLGSTAVCEGQTEVYHEDFETDHSMDGTWVVNSIGGYNPANLFFDYSTVGIPPGPHSTAGTTLGLRLQANLDPLFQTFPSGSSASPVGFSLPDHFEMRWDWWINFNGPLPAGGSGSTQVGGAGFGTAGVIAQAAGAPIDSILAAATGEPTGSAADYRLYAPAFPASFQDGSGVYAAPNLPAPFGARNHLNPYYQAAFPPVMAPPDQVALYPQQGGLTEAGSLGMAWHVGSLKKAGNIVTWSVDGVVIATVDLTVCGFLGGDKIVFSHFDSNRTASGDPNAPALAFSLVDNISVYDSCLGDAEPPAITVPGDIVVPATSPDGAVVFFEVTATDNCPTSLSVICDPVSGSTFPIGISTVSCLAQDAAGNVAMSSFNVRVKGAAEEITDLASLVASLPILPGLANSLLVKLQAADAALGVGEIMASCGTLGAFTAEVSAQAAKREITQEQAELLIGEVIRIRAVLACMP